MNTGLSLEEEMNSPAQLSVLRFNVRQNICWKSFTQQGL